jgi:prepilin-type N-terminal cleavage/methylation domain-containing protein
MMSLKENPNPKARRSRKGFSIMEVMIATAVLGIAMAGLVKLHSAAIRGTKTTRDLSIAEDIAKQIADEMAARDGATLPSTITAATHPCSGVIGGCKGGTGGVTRTFAAEKPGTCTAWFDAAGTARRLDGSMDKGAPPRTEADALAAGAHYRVDRVVRMHPDPASRSTLIEVFVCWRDQGEIVRQAHTRRVVI